MSKDLNTDKHSFFKEFKMFKENHKPDFELKDIFEIYLPFWFCRQNIVVEKDIELDRFSKIILQTIQNGFTKHSEVCDFLGIEVNSFVTIQFHFLIKNVLLNEIPISNDIQYEITYEGLSFLERKKKIKTLETVEFEYCYNDLTLEFLDKHRFDFLVNDLTKDFVDVNKPLDKKNLSEGKQKKFSGYKVLQTNHLPPDRIEIQHKNRPYNLNKVEFAKFFNAQNKDVMFYDYENNNIETHKRSICFLAFEYEENAGIKKYEIRHFRRTVNEFNEYTLEENLTKQVTEYFKKNPKK